MFNTGDYVFGTVDITNVHSGGGALCGESGAHPGRRAGLLLSLRNLPPHQRGRI